jgi:hypothetical protein
MLLYCIVECKLISHGKEGRPLFQFQFHNQNIIVMETSLYDACKQGDISLVEWMISKAANNWNMGLEGACEGGHVHLVELMISKCANSWNVGLYCACKGGYLGLVELMISKGADDLNWGLYGACEGGHVSSVQLMISKGAHECACEAYYSKEIHLLFLEKGLVDVVNTQDLNVVNFLISHGIGYRQFSDEKMCIHARNEMAYCMKKFLLFIFPVQLIEHVIVSYS